jgi:hypothetical protein
MTAPLGWTVSTRGGFAHFVPAQTETRHNANSYVRTACGRRMNLGRLMAAGAPGSDLTGARYCDTCQRRAEFVEPQ